MSVEGQNVGVRASINMLENEQHRALRELALGSTTALLRIQDIDAQISALRAQIVPES